MANELMRAECDPACGFMVQSHDKEEVSQMTMDHAKNAHDKMVSRDEVMKMMKPV